MTSEPVPEVVGTANHRRDRARDLVLTVIVAEAAAMLQQDRHAFGHVHAGTAADAQHHVGLEVAAFGNAAGNAFDRKIGLGAVIDFHRHAIGFEVGNDRLELGIRAHARIGADQGALADSGRYHADGGALAGAE